MFIALLLGGSNFVSAVISERLDLARSGFRQSKGTNYSKNASNKEILVRFEIYIEFPFDCRKPLLAKSSRSEMTAETKLLPPKKNGEKIAFRFSLFMAPNIYPLLASGRYDKAVACQSRCQTIPRMSRE